MAKTRGGLGRGLNSLLGGSNDAALSQEKASTVERATVEPEKAVVPEEPKEDKPEEAVVIEERAPEVPADETAETVEKAPAEALYSNSEDHVTIMGVVERPAARPAAAVEAPAPATAEIAQPSDEVDIDLVDPNPDQPRQNFKKEDLAELAESIKRNGLLQPILVRKTADGRYQIIAGERRYQACRQLGMKRIPVRVKEADEDETIMLALVENIQRSDLNPIEEAYGYRRMMERGNMTQAEVAQAVSKGRSTIANALRLLELPEDAQQLLYEEKITAGHARAILSIPTKEGRRKLTDKLVEEQLSVRETEAIARLLAGKVEKKAEPRTPAPKTYRTVARALCETLGTEVKIKSVKGKNKIEISFKDEAELERLFRVIARQ